MPQNNELLHNSYSAAIDQVDVQLSSTVSTPVLTPAKFSELTDKRNEREVAFGVALNL